MNNEPPTPVLEAHYSNLTFLRVAAHLNDWSAKTFGSVSARGPQGPLDHLEKEELVELRDEVEALELCEDPEEAQEIRAKLATECADVIILAIEVAFRSGVPSGPLTEAVRNKINVIGAREYPPLADQVPNLPVHRINHRSNDA
jgi:hypothetical protein